MSADDCGHDRRTLYEVCKDCAYFWPKKGACQLFEKTDISERVLHIYKDEPPTCSAKMHSDHSNWQFLRALHFAIDIHIYPPAATERLCALAGQPYVPLEFNPAKMLAAALKAQNVDLEHF